MMYNISICVPFPCANQDSVFVVCGCGDVKEEEKKTEREREREEKKVSPWKEIKNEEQQHHFIYVP